MRHRHTHPLPLLIFLLLCAFLLSAVIILPRVAEDSFGPPDQALSTWQKLYYSLDLLWNSSDLLIPRSQMGNEVLFVISPGEDAYLISSNLEKAGLIRNGRIFQRYLAWTGMDAYLQVGTYRLNSSLSAEAIAGMLQSITLSEVYFSILPGWRLEEVAASLPTSGLLINPYEFLSTAYAPPPFPNLIPPGCSVEGYLFPDIYILARNTNVDQFISVLIQGFLSNIPSDYLSAFAERGLTLHEAVTLASIIQREAIDETEMPVIASVFFNRLAVNMKLQTDPTVQYALGYDAVQETWWTTPLSISDLLFESPYNTYLYSGIPPGPISNPGINALRAVAYPQESPYYFFQARCDGSGFHNFSETFEQHKLNNCP